MRYLMCILILLFASPAFADHFSSAFSGANGVTDEPAAVQSKSVVDQDPDFRINERLYNESIGSYGYYGGGFYGEERYAALIDFFTISSNPGDLEIGTGLSVVDGQVLPFNLGSPFLGFTGFGSGIFSGGIGVNFGNLTFFRGGIGQSGFGHGSFGFGQGGFGQGGFGFGHGGFGHGGFGH